MNTTPSNETEHHALRNIGVIIPAAGCGTRMETTQPKQFLTLSGELILIRTIRCFLEYSSNITVNVVLSADHIESARRRILSSFPDVPLNLLFFTIFNKNFSGNSVFHRFSPNFKK
ncbi:MAG: hypothetical protein DSY50_02555, partial [Desulfobulbus sp.]